MSKNGLHCKTCCYEMESTYMEEFYVGKKNELHFVAVCSESSCIIDITRKMSFFKEKFIIHNKLRAEELVYSLNELYDYTNESIPEIIKKYTNISIDVIKVLGIKLDEYGCKYGMSYTKGLLRSPDFEVRLIDGKDVVINTTEEFYREHRIAQINKRRENISSMQAKLSYPWGK